MFVSQITFLGVAFLIAELPIDNTPLPIVKDFRLEQPSNLLNVDNQEIAF